MTVTVNLRFPTYTDTLVDCNRVEKLIRNSVIGKSLDLKSNVYEREAKYGGGYGYIIHCGPISITCRAITRYTVSYAVPMSQGNHRHEFEAVTAEEALEQCREFLENTIEHARLSLAILAGPDS